MEIVSLAAVMAYGFDMLPPKDKKGAAWNPGGDDKKLPFGMIGPLSEVHVRLERSSGR